MNQLFEWAPPAFIPPEPWAAFVAMRTRGGRKKDWTERARDRAVSKLKAMHERGIDIGEVLLTCEEFGWVGVEWGEDHVIKQASRIAHSRRELAATNQPFVPTSKQGAALARMEATKRGPR